MRLAGRPKAQHALSIAEFSVTMTTMPLSPKAAVKEVQDLSFLAGKAFASCSAALFTSATSSCKWTQLASDPSPSLC